MKKTLISMLLAAVCVVGANAQEASQDPDSLYAKCLLPMGADAPAFPELQKGEWTVIDFWATWCPDCRKEIPTVKALYEQFGQKVKFVGVSFDDDRDKLESYVKSNGVEWTQYSEFKKWRETTISKAYQIQWIPSMYLVSPEGKVVYTTVVAERMGEKLKQMVADGILE